MKTGFLLRGGKGKLAGVTLYKDKSTGETIMREVVSPNNPQTEKQMIQRIIMHTVGQAYAKMKEICDHSFEGMKKGRETMAYFIGQNVQFLREKIANAQAAGEEFYDMYSYVPLKLKGFTPNQYQVAMGSLPRVTTTLDDDEPTKAFVPAVTTNTYQGVMDALGLQRGDQLTFMLIKLDGTTFGANSFEFARVILDPTNAEGLAAPLSTEFVANGKITLPSVRNEGEMNFAVGASGLTFQSKKAGSLVCAAVIVSRQASDEKWLRSTTYLTFNNNGEYSLGDCLDRAAKGVANTIYAANELYLNNAGEGGTATSESGESGSGSSESGSGSNQGGSTLPGSGGVETGG